MASKCVTRADVIALGARNLKKLQSMGLFANGIPSEATLHRMEKGIDEDGLAERMSRFAQGLLSAKAPKCLRKKLSDKAMGMTELMRRV